MTSTHVSPRRAPDLSALVTDEMREQYEQEGYFLLEKVLTDEQLDLLREVADFAVAKVDAQMDE